MGCGHFQKASALSFQGALVYACVVRSRVGKCVSLTDRCMTAAGASRSPMTAVVVVRARGNIGDEMFSSIGIPEIVTGVILAIAAVGLWLFRKGGGRRIL